MGGADNRVNNEVPFTATRLRRGVQGSHGFPARLPAFLTARRQVHIIELGGFSKTAREGEDDHDQ